MIRRIERITKRPVRPLRGALADSGNPAVASCPDPISEAVAAFYALSECGRLFHWRIGGTLREQSAYCGRYSITVRGVTWQVARAVLLDRLFPDRPLDVDADSVDWSAYDPDGPIPGVDDPLAERSFPGDSVIQKRGATADEADRAHRLWYG